MCKYFHKSSAVTVGDTEVTISFADSPTGIVDKQRFCFAICQTIPTAEPTLPVELLINGVGVPLWDKHGNPVLCSNLLNRYVIRGYFGEGTVDHVITTSLPAKSCAICSNNCWE